VEKKTLSDTYREVEEKGGDGAERRERGSAARVGRPWCIKKRKRGRWQASGEGEKIMRSLPGSYRRKTTYRNFSRELGWAGLLVWIS
jgi:hypothetical protein